jgi:RNA polymerase sigma factor (sigma-70 family)
MIQDKTHMTDSELVSLVRSGDGAGLSFVYEKYRKEFLNWIRKFNNCTQDEAKEFYQAATVILYENIMASKITELQSSLKTYLFGIGKNLAYQHHRHNQRMDKIKAGYMVEVELRSDSGHGMQSDFDLNIVQHCLVAIGEPCRQLLDYFYFQRKSMDEISSTMGYKNPETAKNQKYKCMERLRKMVEDERRTTVNTIED